MEKRFVPFDPRPSPPLQSRFVRGFINQRHTASSFERRPSKGGAPTPEPLAINENDLEMALWPERLAIKRLVCPTDFSIHAAEALDVAIAFAQLISASITLVHVGTPKRTRGRIEGPKAKLRRRCQAKLAGEAARAREQGIPVREAFLEGSPAESITKLAAKGGADLIVMSSLGPGTLKWWLAGSVAVRTIRISPVPVMIVQNRNPLLERAFGTRGLRILIGSDAPMGAAFADWSRTLLRIAPSFRTCGPLFRPLPLGMDGPSYRLGAAATQTQGLPEVAFAQAVDGELNDQCFEVPVQPAWRCFGAKLAKAAKAIQADLMVCAINERSALGRLCCGSVARELLQENFSTNLLWIPLSPKTGRMPHPACNEGMALGRLSMSPQS